jgi:3',5'-cyclic AMP phosphodiesterase CpdA
MTTFNIVHLTDLHFAEIPKRANIFTKIGSIRKGTSRMPPSHNPQVAERVAAWLYAETQQLEAAGDQLDALILSGDLATTGIQDDLEAAFRYVDTPPALRYFGDALPGIPRDSPHLATIAGLAKHCLLIPGNHDRYMDNGGEAGGKVFNRVFKKYWKGNKDGVIGIIIPKPAAGPAGASADGFERLAIIGGDGCLRDAAHASLPTYQWTQGYLYPDTEEEFKAKTLEARRQFPDIAVIWVIHFPPHPSVPSREAMRRYDLIAQASDQLGVAIILSGHTHLNRAYPPGTASAIWNGGSATQFAEKRGNWVQFIKIEVANNRLVSASRQNFKWEKRNSVYDFFPDSLNTIP